MRRMLKHVLPAKLRKRLLRSAAHWRTGRIVRLIRAGGTIGNKEVCELRKGWGNDGFSADSRYILETIRLMREHPGDVLECGTGVTTLVAGLLAEKSGHQVYSLEQDRNWGLETRRILERYDVRCVKILDSPLRQSDGFVWYDIQGLKLPRSFGLVICDGPFVPPSLGEPWYRSWRYGVMRHLKDSSTFFAALLLDDVDDPRANGVLERWRSDFNAAVQVISSEEGRCGIITRA